VVKENRDLAPIAMSKDDLAAFIVANATPLDEVVPEWQPFTKENLAAMKHFYIVSAELRNGDNGEFYIFGVWTEGWDAPEPVLFGKGNVKQRDEIYDYVSQTRKPMGPCWCELIPSKVAGRQPLALIRHGENPDFPLESEADIPF